MKTLDIAWLAGLLEGEGAFVSVNGQPRITLSSTDRDIVERVATMFGGMRVKPRMTSRLGKKQQFETSAYSRQAASWMMTIFVFMSEHRKNQIRTILMRWRSMRGESMEKKIAKAAHMRACRLGRYHR